MGWLYRDDSLAIGQRDRVFDGSSLIFVYVNAAFRIQDLFQAFSRARLRRWAVFGSGQESWPDDYEDYDDAERNRPHESIIQPRLRQGADKVRQAIFPASADALRAGRPCRSQGHHTEEYGDPASSGYGRAIAGVGCEISLMASCASVSSCSINRTDTSRIFSDWVWSASSLMA